MVKMLNQYRGVYNFFLFIGVFFFFSSFSSKVFAQSVFDYNFDSLSTGAINGQDLWTASNAEVSNTFSESVSNSIKMTASITNTASRDVGASFPSTGYYDFWVYTDCAGDTPAVAPAIYLANTAKAPVYFYCISTSEYKITDNTGSPIYINNITAGVWHYFKVSYDTSDTYTVQLDNNSPVNITLGASGFNTNLINFAFTNFSDSDWYFDSFGTAITAPDISTHFISTFPIDDSIETSPVDIGATWYISTDDIDQFSDGILGFGEGTLRFGVQLCPLNTIPVSLCTPVQDFQTTNIYESSSTVSVSFGSSLPLRDNTDYKAIFSLTGSNYSNIFGNIFSISTTTYFTVGSTTHAGNVRSYVNEVESTVFRQNNASSSSAYAVVNASCNPLSSGFDVALCIYSVIAPPQEILDQDIEDIKSQFLTVAPWGYLTRFIQIVSTTTTSALPSISYTFGTTSPFYSSIGTISFDPFGSLATSTGPLSYVSDQTDQKTIFEIMSEIVNIIIYLMLVFLIIRDLTGIHKHEINKEGGVGNKPYGPKK